MTDNQHKIEDRFVTHSDIGSHVTYIPPHANGSASHPDSERGTISSWNDKFIFVRYAGNSKATPANLLVWG